MTKTINQLIWPGGKLKRNRHWDIQFAPVKDENQNEIPSLFVVIISVVSLRGGLFTHEPESYYVVHSRFVRMTFAEWRRRFFPDEQSSAVTDMVPSVVGQTILVRSALDHYIKALQHSKTSSVEQEFFITVADTKQRICIFRAVTLLGDFATGANFRKATPSDIKAAETDLSVCDRLILEGFKETKYCKIYHLFSLSDLLVCRWWQKQQQQQTKEERSFEDYKTSNLLKEAFDYATEAEELSTKFHFELLNTYARYRLAVIIEIMLKLNVSSLCHPKNRVSND